MSRKRYSVAFLAGHGIGAGGDGPGVARSQRQPPQMHGFRLDDEHVAVRVRTRSSATGTRSRPSSRRAVRERLGRRARPRRRRAVRSRRCSRSSTCAPSIVRVRVDDAQRRSRSSRRSTTEALGLDGRAGLRARARTAARRVTLVRADDDGRAASRPRRRSRPTGSQFERVGLGDAVRRLVESPRGTRRRASAGPRTSPRPPRSPAARRRRASRPGAGVGPRGPGVFGPTHGAAIEIAGQGVADPRSMLLAAALMLGEGLGERAAAETLSAPSRGRRSRQRPTRPPASATACSRSCRTRLRFEFGGAVA